MKPVSSLQSGRASVAALASWIVMATCYCEEPLKTSLMWTWGLIDHPEWCDSFKAAGFNSVVMPVPRTNKWWLEPDGMRAGQALLEKAAALQLGVYVQFPIGMGQGTTYGTRTVTAAGFTEPRLACPLSGTFWAEYMIPAISRLAVESVKSPGLKGVILDTEQYYGTERSGAINDNYCFCDECFGGFLQATHSSAVLPEPSLRMAWLTRESKVSAYWDYLEKRMQKRTEELVTSLKAKSPDFAVHFYIFDNTWYYRGLLKGLKASGHPVIVCDEKSYYGYLRDRRSEVMAALQSLNANAIWSPGFYTGALNPRAMGVNVRQAIKDGGSYWVYNSKLPFPTSYLSELEKQVK